MSSYKAPDKKGNDPNDKKGGDKKGSDAFNWRLKPEPIAVDDVKQKLITGQYRLVWVGEVVSGNSTSSSGEKFYVYNVTDANGNKKGEYHIHKTEGGEFVSGNLKVPAGTSGFMATVGRAADHKDDLLPMALSAHQPT